MIIFQCNYAFDSGILLLMFIELKPVVVVVVVVGV